MIFLDWDIKVSELVVSVKSWSLIHHSTVIVIHLFTVTIH